MLLDILLFVIALNIGNNSSYLLHFNLLSMKSKILP